MTPMPSPSPRPRSTLAPATASKGWAGVIAPAPLKRPEDKPASTPSRAPSQVPLHAPSRAPGAPKGPAKAAKIAKPAAARGKRTGVAGAAAVEERRRTETALRERVLVTALVAFGIAIAVLGSVRVAGNVRVSRAEEAMVGTFDRVEGEQAQFRRANLRFASWSELAKSGMRLPARQTVHRATADQSHWFLSLRDRNTGLICDRIGELMDEPDTERKAVCRMPAPAAAAGAVSPAGAVERRAAPRSDGDE